MKHKLLSLAVLSFAASLPVLADGHSGDNAELHAACVADITEKSAAAGTPVNDADEACNCLGKGIQANPGLMGEIESAGGLPPKDEASPELQTVVEACMAADQA